MSALCSAGGVQNLNLLDRTTQRPNPTGTVGWAGSTFGPLTKSRLGEHEFEALMRTMDNLVRAAVTSGYSENRINPSALTSSNRTVVHSFMSQSHYTRAGRKTG